MKNKFTLSKNERDNIIGIIIEAYIAAPEQLEAALPKIAQRLSLILPSKASNVRSFGLTEKERALYTDDLRRLLANLGQYNLSTGQAVQALEKCASLIEDNSLPAEVTRNTLAKLVKTATGLTPSAVKKKMNFTIKDGSATNQISLLRGVLLNTTWDNRMLSIDINPSKVKERRRIVFFVGSAKDSESNVAERHNMYI